MARISVVVLAGTESHADMGRVTSALSLLKKANEAGDEVELVVGGAGVTWVPGLANPEHDLHGLYAAVQERVAGACDVCAVAFGVRRRSGRPAWPSSRSSRGPPSLRNRVEEGCEVVTF